MHGDTYRADARDLRRAVEILRRRLPEKSFTAKLTARLVERVAEWCEREAEQE